MSHLYTVYGLTVACNRPLPALNNRPRSGPADITVHLNTPPPLDSASSLVAECFYSSGPEEPGAGLSAFRLDHGRYFRFLYSDGTEFTIDQRGTQIWSTWDSRYSPEYAVTYLFGPVLGFALRLRGITSLHASGVCVDGRAIALVGAGGRGKSTLAAAFSLQRTRVLSEDVLALRSDGSRGFLVQPGYPRINLWPDSAEMLFGSADTLPLIAPEWSKRYLALSADQFHPASLPLAAIYFLGERTKGGKDVIQAVESKKAFLDVLANVYGSYLSDTAGRKRDFELLHRLLDSVTVRHISPASSVHDTVNSVLKDLHALSTETLLTR